MPQVIWAIGISLIVLAAFVRLPTAATLAIGVVIVLGHNLLDGLQVPAGPASPAPGPLALLWILVHQGGFFPISTALPGCMVLAQYPILPWVGVLFTGYAAASLYAWLPDRRRRALVAGGLAMVAGFIVLRFSNLYGDPTPWESGATATQTVMSFLRVSKYPPSLLFVLATLGPSLVVLGSLDGRAIRGGAWGAVVTFGRVPLFFYMLQWISAHVTGMVVTAAQGKDVSPYFLNLVQIINLPRPPDIGGPLWTTYAAWTLGTLILYFPCRWFAEVKSRRRDWWLGYL
jgi:uncharacterized membrane protein